jgi:hypothetical protein
MSEFLKRHQIQLTYFTAFTALTAYVIQAYHAMDSIRPSLDEGVYLLKGYLLASGVFTPYQPYGVWMNKMPLSFLIPGWVEVLFSPGLITGRWYAFILSVLILPGIWLIARRFSGEKVATLILVLIAINPTGIKFYAQAISQGLIAFLLVWSLFFLLGEKRRNWQIVMGSVLAAIIVFTRENMLPYILFIVVLMFWQHGKKAGWISFATIGILLLIGHAIFFPEILTNWVKWIPQSITPFLDPWRIRNPEEISYSESISLMSYVLIFMQGLRWHFFVTLGLGITGLLTSIQKLKMNSWKFKPVIVLSGLYVILFLMHTWASLGNDYCKFCLPGYISFFSPIGFILLSILIPALSPTILRGWGWMVSFLFVMITTLFGFATHQDFVRLPSYSNWLDGFFEFPVPWMRKGQLILGKVKFWQILANKFNLTFEQVRLEVLPVLIPTILGFVVGIVWIVLVFLMYRAIKNKRNISLSFLLLTSFLLVAILLSPTWILSGGMFTYDCGTDVMDQIEQSGQQLANQISPGARIDWRVTSMSPILLLYLDDPQLLPAQINSTYSYVNGGDSDYLSKYGFWNVESAYKWMSQADFFLATPPISPDVWRQLQDFGFQEIPPLSPALQCENERFEIQIFQKNVGSIFNKVKVNQ